MTRCAEGVEVLCPLRFEAARLRRGLAGTDVQVRCIGPGRAGVERWFDRQGATGDDSNTAKRVILAGLAGGLHECVHTGSAYRVAGVVQPDGALIAGDRRGDGENACDGLRVTSVEHAVRTAADRRALHVRSGAHLVDQESVWFVREAMSRGIRWMIVRGVSDGVDDALPRTIDRWIDEHGRTRAAAVVKSMVLNPGSLAQVNRLRINAARALDDAVRIIRDEMREAE